MTHYFLIQYRQTGSNELREEKRGEHIAYRKGLGAALALAGPLLDEEGRPVGSVIILRAEDRGAAERIATSDPFVAAGLLELESIQAMRIAAMAPPA
ncbi:hypothetical protein GCM10007897_21900 [Sphingobium jiangsuense]|uniref:YCII-related domain-containing protein n=1 Tax=Sphingobium jiangsuense TaxID=870476 RepID=A0A7W6BRE6_9SPHN|nr:YciI family protein [Sphingobium jiangsuense]MBB3927398.1 hypothetical protein [Sphingobium jiangsuense]GLT00800.1 hypothetical protein GCM10007897_21900 [Sphingobium jiangsuense]